MEDPRSLINVDRINQEMDRAGIDVLVAASPEDTFYLSGSFIRTQISIRDRLALVVWPREGEPTYIVCNIEESLAQKQTWIKDLRLYVEHAETPIEKLIEVLNERGLNDKRVGIEERYLTAEYYHELVENSPATFVRADEAMERARAIKTPGEIRRIQDAFIKTDEAIHEAWTSSRAGDTEAQVAKRMIEAVQRRGAETVRHISFNAGENTVISHRSPGDRKLAPGDTVITDFGANWGGFNSDIARVGIVAEPSDAVREEYRRYQEAYVKCLLGFKPGMTGADVFNMSVQVFRDYGMELPGPHVGHSVSRAAGHENPVLHPGNTQQLEPNMLIAYEPVWPRPENDRKYHLEDLVLITEDGCKVLTDYETTREMIRIPG
jgi:Xaa-Pro aminopeptidase